MYIIYMYMYVYIYIYVYTHAKKKKMNHLVLPTRGRAMPTTCDKKIPLFYHILLGGRWGFIEWIMISVVYID